MAPGGQHHNSRRTHPLPAPGRTQKACVHGRRDLQSSPAVECNRISWPPSKTPGRLGRGSRFPGWAGSPANFSAQDGNPGDLKGGASLKTAARHRISDHSVSELTNCREALAHPSHHLVCVFHLAALRAAVAAHEVNSWA